jgi:response regulator RpfG family c-di-GMP phosphodiesterase
MQLRFSVEGFLKRHPLKKSNPAVRVLSPETAEDLVSPTAGKEGLLVAVVPICEGQGCLALERDASMGWHPEELEFLETTAEMITTSLALQAQIIQVRSRMHSAKRDELQQLRDGLLKLVEQIHALQVTFIWRLGRAVDSRIHGKIEHSSWMAHITSAMAEALSLNDKTTDILRTAALISSIGAFNINDGLKKKHHYFQRQEKHQWLKQHNQGLKLLEHIYTLGEVYPYLKYINECWNGTGLPEGLTGWHIPLGSRILALANAYCALRQPRAYRATGQKGYTHKQAIAQLQQESNLRWDPDLVYLLASLPETRLKRPMLKTPGL